MGVDFDLVWQTAVDNIPTLLAALKDLIGDE